jgi:predicted nucleic acid-binding protein
VTGWLLDTDVLSALAPGKRPVSAEAAAWFRDRTDALFLSTVTIAEIEAGIAKLHRTGARQRAVALRGWFDRLTELYGERILAFDLAAARIAGALGDAATARGRNPGFAAVAIAAIAGARQLVVVTVNTRHFDALGIETHNPLWPQ